jgi:hypothetical protein
LREANEDEGDDLQELSERLCETASGNFSRTGSWLKDHPQRRVLQYQGQCSDFTRKDAITETSTLERRNFRLIIKELEGEYPAEAYHPDSGKLLGFVRYLDDKGTLELTNFRARLSRKTLDLGVTSKRKEERLAGTHGEGFKVASLVMARHGYQVRFEASSY